MKKKEEVVGGGRRGEVGERKIKTFMRRSLWCVFVLIYVSIYYWKVSDPLSFTRAHNKSLVHCVLATFRPPQMQYDRAVSPITLSLYNGGVRLHNGAHWAAIVRQTPRNQTMGCEGNICSVSSGRCICGHRGKG